MLDYTMVQVEDWANSISCTSLNSGHIMIWLKYLTLSCLNLPDQLCACWNFSSNANTTGKQYLDTHITMHKLDVCLCTCDLGFITKNRCDEQSDKKSKKERPKQFGCFESRSQRSHYVRCKTFYMVPIISYFCFTIILTKYVKEKCWWFFYFEHFTYCIIPKYLAFMVSGTFTTNSKDWRHMGTVISDYMICGT